MTGISARQGLTKPGYNWRVVDIVVAALISIAGGVIFWAWDQMALVATPMSAGYPPLSGLIAGGWMIPAVLGMVAGTTAILTGEDSAHFYIVLLLTYDVVFTTACLGLFGTILHAE